MRPINYASRRGFRVVAALLASKPRKPPMVFRPTPTSKRQTEPELCVCPNCCGASAARAAYRDRMLSQLRADVAKYIPVLS